MEAVRGALARRGLWAGSKPFTAGFGPVRRLPTAMKGRYSAATDAAMVLSTTTESSLRKPSTSTAEMAK